MGLRKQLTQNIKPGKIFTLDEIGIEPQKKASVCVILSTMIANNELSRIENGAYYIPVKSPLFGSLPPDESEIISYVCRKNDGYPSGLSLYNKLGLTEQVPNVTEIAVPSKKYKNKRISGVNISFIRAYTSPQGKDLYLLQLLDAMTHIKYIPGRTVEEAVQELKLLIKKLTERQVKEISSYANDYPPRTRYILSRIFEETGNDSEAVILKETLNKITKFVY
ncbi:MAG: DUF6088 family protein [Bacteroidales bacterium]|nr:DUF6088 family protein [Bacteroidales bacterium]